MHWTQRFKKFLLLDVRKPKSPLPRRAPDESGIALFMVLGAVAVLSVLVTEFTYITQVNQRMAYDGLDQLKAHYLAKSGYKIALLRLKAYQQVKALVSGQGGQLPIPKGILEKIWNFPFFYPIPKNVPGMSAGDKDRIDKFMKESKLEGSYNSVIESESSRFNLNSIFAQFAGEPGPSPSPSASASADMDAEPNASPSPKASYNPDAARKSLHEYLVQIWDQKVQEDQDFAEENHDFHLDDFEDNLLAWSDVHYEQRRPHNLQTTKLKRAPFFTVDELHMVAPINDAIFNLFAPNFTAGTTPGINVNTLKEKTLKALFPAMLKEEVAEFFKFRDAPDKDNSFKDGEDFFTYLQGKVPSLGGEKGIKLLRSDFEKRQLRFVAEESIFRINVEARVNQATRLLEAVVMLLPVKSTPTPSASPKAGEAIPPKPPAASPPLSGPGMTDNDEKGSAATGLKVIFMRIL